MGVCERVRVYCRESYVLSNLSLVGLITNCILIINFQFDFFSLINLCVDTKPIHTHTV